MKIQHKHNLTINITDLMKELEFDIKAAIYMTMVYIKDEMGLNINIRYDNIVEQLNEQQFTITKSNADWFLTI